MTNTPVVPAPGLSLAPFRALRPAVDPDRVARMLCPPYDVIDPAERERLLAGDPDNAVAAILPEGHDGVDAYAAAAELLTRWVEDGTYAVDSQPAIYIYEMADSASTTRGLLGAVGLSDPAEGVILPHENTMAGPVADRLALMSATDANLEPIYLVYDGGGAASRVVENAGEHAPIVEASTPDGITHRLWAVADPEVHQEIADDLAPRRALIADGHHRYATYLEMQRRYRSERGPGPWDRGLTLLVDSRSYGPQVHAIHRVLVAVPLSRALDLVRQRAQTELASTAEEALRRAALVDGFAVVLTDGTQFVVVTDPHGSLAAAASRPDEPAALAGLDVTVLHRVLVRDVWGLADTVESVGYAHSVEQAVSTAQACQGTAVLLRPTPPAAVAAVAAAGARMPRKSTLFTPKPASGLVMRRFADQFAR
jgi:uncharacterized protein (DUF1015 family)